MDIRLIGAPEDMPAAIAAMNRAFVVGSCKRYPSRNSSDARIYMQAIPRGAPELSRSFEPDGIESLKIRLKDRGGRNHVLIMAEFAADSYITAYKAGEINRTIQDELRFDIQSDLSDVVLRLDQSFKPPQLTVYSGPSVTFLI